jgi:GPH family glycoside/pentoside/hexuronide:cation symporter
MAREGIRWFHYGGTVSLIVLQVLVVLYWPMDGLHARIQRDIAARDAKKNENSCLVSGIAA